MWSFHSKDHLCELARRTARVSTETNGLMSSLALLDEHVMGSDPFLPAPPALWVAALAAPLLAHSLQHPVRPSGHMLSSPSSIMREYPHLEV